MRLCEHGHQLTLERSWFKRWDSTLMIGAMGTGVWMTTLSNVRCFSTCGRYLKMSRMGRMYWWSYWGWGSLVSMFAQIDKFKWLMSYQIWVNIVNNLSFNSVNCNLVWSIRPKWIIFNTSNKSTQINIDWYNLLKWALTITEAIDIVMVSWLVCLASIIQSLNPT